MLDESQIHLYTNQSQLRNNLWNKIRDVFAPSSMQIFKDICIEYKKTVFRQRLKYFKKYVYKSRKVLKYFYLNYKTLYNMSNAFVKLPST